jgi:Domain of Unknown Function (DUF1206)
MPVIPRPWIRAAARCGFAAKALVYLILGVLAWNAAMGTGGRVTDPHGAFLAVMRTPFGRLTLAVLTLGLAGYAAWRFIEAFADANHLGRSWKALATRAEYTLSGLVYSAFAIDAARLVAALPSRGGAPAFASLVGRAALSWVGFVAGALIIGAAALEMRDAVTGKLSDRLDLHAVSRRHGHWIVLVSRIGVGARAIILAGLGVLLIGLVGSQADPTSTNTSDSLRFLSRLPQGRTVLACVSAGLMAYGVYQLLHARYRRITPP